jgi:hypothetical protein
MGIRSVGLWLAVAVPLVAGCSNPSTPTSPSRASTTKAEATAVTTTSTASATAAIASVGGVSGVRQGAASVAPDLFRSRDGGNDPLDVIFPPRNQTVDFGLQLNQVYRDLLLRSPVATFVDLEGWVVWIQEYLRYRVNGCSHFDASFRVGVQIGGGGVPTVCAIIPAGVVVPFPPRNESFAFGLELNEVYRDLLRRGAVAANVDLEGWIVWISEYLRYRTFGCSHNDASFRVGVQIGGGGVPPVC